MLLSSLPTLTFGYEVHQILEGITLPSSLQTSNFVFKFHAAEQPADIDLWLRATPNFGGRYTAEQPANVDHRLQVQPELGGRHDAGLDFGYEFARSLEGVAMPSSQQTWSLQGATPPSSLRT